MNERKILFAPEFEHYHSLLITHGESLIENFKQTLFAARYDDSSRILEFGIKSDFDKVLEMFEDGYGGVIIKLNGAPYVETTNSTGGVTVTIG